MEVDFYILAIEVVDPSQILAYSGRTEVVYPFQALWDGHAKHNEHGDLVTKMPARPKPPSPLQVPD